MAMQVVTVNGKEYMVQLTEIHNNDIVSAQKKLENARAIERSTDISFILRTRRKRLIGSPIAYSISRIKGSSFNAVQ